MIGLVAAVTVKGVVNSLTLCGLLVVAYLVGRYQEVKANMRRRREGEQALDEELAEIKAGAERLVRKMEHQAAQAERESIERTNRRLRIIAALRERTWVEAFVAGAQRMAEHVQDSSRYGESPLLRQHARDAMETAKLVAIEDWLKEEEEVVNAEGKRPKTGELVFWNRAQPQAAEAADQREEGGAA